jgi:predicted esterase
VEPWLCMQGKFCGYGRVWVEFRRRRLQFTEPLKAICSFNGYVLPEDQLGETSSMENAETLVLAMNASEDQVVDIRFAEECFEALRAVHPNVDFQVDFSGNGKMISHEAIHSLANIVVSEFED